MILSRAACAIAAGTGERRWSSRASVLLAHIETMQIRSAIHKG